MATSKDAILAACLQILGVSPTVNPDYDLTVRAALLRVLLSGLTISPTGVVTTTQPINVPVDMTLATGTLAVGHGGTGLTTVAANRVLLTNVLDTVIAAQIANAHIDAAAAIAWTKINKTGSSLADLTTASAGDLSSGTLAPARNASITALTDGATVALDASLGNVFRLSAAGNRTILTPTNPTAGQKIIIIHAASGADRTLTLTTGANAFRFGTDITSLTLTTSGKSDYLGCVWNSTDSRWDLVAAVKGF